MHNFDPVNKFKGSCSYDIEIKSFKRYGYLNMCILLEQTETNMMLTSKKKQQTVLYSDSIFLE